MRIALIGAGFFSRFHLDAWRRLDVEVVAVVDADVAKAAATARWSRPSPRADCR